MIERICAIIVCGGLDAAGGYHWLWMRRYLMPVVIGASASIATGVWWTGFMVLPVMGTLCIGYSKEGNFGRAWWLFLQAVVISLGLFLTGHLAWYFYVPYILGAGVLGGLYKNWNQLVGDFITGSWLGLVILFVH